jgi:hypothetical protein
MKQPSVIDDEKIQGEMLSNSLNDKFRDKKFIGPSWDKKSKMFKCHLRCHPLRETSFYLGAYILEVDAALAYDKGVDALQLNDVRQKNFTESADYEKARQIELLDLDRRGICIDDVGSLEEVANHIECMVAKKCQGFENNMYYTDVRDKNKCKKFVGTNWHKSTNKFEAKLQVGSTKYYLGLYNLEADAALAYDKAVEALQLEISKQKNFTDSSDYERARDTELLDLDRRGVCIDDVGSLKEVANHIECIVEKCKSVETRSPQTNIAVQRQNTCQAATASVRGKHVCESQILLRQQLTDF